SCSVRGRWREQQAACAPLGRSGAAGPGCARPARDDRGGSASRARVRGQEGHPIPGRRLAAVAGIAHFGLSGDVARAGSRSAAGSDRAAVVPACPGETEPCLRFVVRASSAAPAPVSRVSLFGASMVRLVLVLLLLAACSSGRSMPTTT